MEYIKTTNIVVNFLKSIAKKNGFQLFDSIFGEIELNFDPSLNTINQSSGSIYGIWLVSSKKIEKYKDFLELSLSNELKFYYRLYWGKDVTPTSRILAHARVRKSTGTCDLSNFIYEKLIFGYVHTSKYEEFEKYLHEKYPTLLSKRNGGGRKANIINILN